MSRRLAWMDSLRGFAILLVLIWHASAIPALLGVEMPIWLRTANDVLLPFRMPMLMFLSGLLLVRSLAKPLRVYYLGKLQLIAWPYLLFALLHNVSFEAVAPLWHPRAWISTGYLWFLFFILIYYLVAPLLKQIPPAIVPLFCFALAIVLPHDDAFQRFFYFAGFFFTGYLASRHRDQFERISSNGHIALVGGVAAAVLGSFSALNDVQYRAEFALLSLGGIISAVYVMRRVGDAPWTRPLQFVGRTSLVYYTAHFPIMHFSLLGLLAVGLSSSLFIAPAVFVIAIAASTGLAIAYSKGVRPIAWLFRAPFPPSWMSEKGPKADRPSA